MANLENDPPAQTLGHPVFREPDALVENIYPLPGSLQEPDLESQDVMGEYLIDRFMPPKGPRIRLVMTPSGHTLPGIRRLPGELKEVSRWRRTREWLISPRVAAAVTLGSMALFNAVGNRDTIGGGSEWVGHGIERVLDIAHDKTIIEHHTKTTPGPLSHIEVTADTTNQVGSTTVDPSVIRLFIDQIHQDEQKGGKVVRVEITGNSSDDWASDSSISTPDAGNAQLAQARAEAAVKELQAEGYTPDPATLKLSQQEHVLTSPQKAALLAEAQADGFPSIQSAVNAADSGRSLPVGLAAKVKQLFTGKQDRGVSLSATVEYPGKAKTTTTTTKTIIPDHFPHVPKPKVFGFIPLLPIRKRERYPALKQTHRWEFVPSQQLWRPQIIREDKEQAWLRIRPEAMREDGSFISEAWSYTRKYEHLLRDGRIVDLVRADFKNKSGEDKSLRILFVDEAPADKTVEIFANLLQKFASMDGGVLGDNVSAIFVYPRRNIGTDHNDPKRIAMGIDKQSPDHIAGTFTYPLKLVELHMDTEVFNPEELETMFRQFNEAGFTTAHEVAGHGTDISGEVLRARRVAVRGIPNAYVIDGDPRARKMARLDSLLRRLPRRTAQKTEPIEFDIVYQVPDNDGQLVTVRARVDENDPRLAHATQSTIVGHQPTQYSGESATEHYAETAASVTTGIEVPYPEALVTVPRLTTDNGRPATFATSYRPDVRGQRLFTDSVGAVAGSFPGTFATQPLVQISHLHPANDALIQRELVRTSHLRSPRPEQLAAILARVARRSR